MAAHADIGGNLIMARINGLELKAKRTEPNEDGSSMKICSLYLGSSKVATVLFEKDVPDCDNSTQVLVCHPYCEKKLRELLTKLHPEEKDYSPEKLAEELEWMISLEEEYLRHASAANGGMLALSLEGGQVTLGIPRRYALASDEEILAASQQKIQEYEDYYGTLYGYLIFHSPEDFQKGEAITPEQILKD